MMMIIPLISSLLFPCLFRACAAFEGFPNFPNFNWSPMPPPPTFYNPWQPQPQQANGGGGGGHVEGARRLDLGVYQPPQWDYFGNNQDQMRPYIPSTSSPDILATMAPFTATALPAITSTSTLLPTTTTTKRLLTAETKDDEPSTTTQTILGLFNIVSFNHFSCEAGSGQNGSCYTRAECRTQGGRASKPCAKGFGVCCLFNATCGEEVTRNGTYFVNPRYPLAFSGDGSCAVTIPKKLATMCQLRLDFIDLDLRRPDSGDCNADRLVITGQNANHMVPPLCGLNSGQHIYVDVDMAQGPIQLNVLTSGAGPRLWNMKITMLSCDSPSRAPGNCLQYFTGVKGNFKSFNYDHISTPNDEGYLNNLDYTMCIRKEAGFCNIAYTNGDVAGQYQFSIQNVDKIGMPLLPPDVSGAGMRDCPDDYINLNGIPLCGERMNADSLITNQSTDKAVIDSTPGQFIVRFHSNYAVVSRGFNITFQQQPCGAITLHG